MDHVADLHSAAYDRQISAKHNVRPSHDGKIVPFPNHRIYRLEKLQEGPRVVANEPKILHLVQRHVLYHLIVAVASGIVWVWLFHAVKF